MDRAEIREAPGGPLFTHPGLHLSQSARGPCPPRCLWHPATVFRFSRPGTILTKTSRPHERGRLTVLALISGAVRSN